MEFGDPQGPANSPRALRDVGRATPMGGTVHVCVRVCVCVRVNVVGCGGAGFVWRACACVSVCQSVCLSG